MTANNLTSAHGTTITQKIILAHLMFSFASVSLFVFSCVYGRFLVQLVLLTPIQNFCYTHNFFLTPYYVGLEISSLNLQGTEDKPKRSEIFSRLRKKISAYTNYKRNIVLRRKLQLLLILVL